jgi:hypothetical protein
MYQVPCSLFLSQLNSVFPEFAPTNFFLVTTMETTLQLHGEGTCCDDNTQVMRFGFHYSEESDCGIFDYDAT